MPTLDSARRSGLSAGSFMNLSGTTLSSPFAHVSVVAVVVVSIISAVTKAPRGF